MTDVSPLVTTMKGGLVASEGTPACVTKPVWLIVKSEPSVLVVSTNCELFGVPVTLP